MSGLKRCLCLVAVLMAAPACDDPLADACTLIGCVDGLQVVLDGLEADSATITLQAPVAPPWTISCEHAHCAGGVVFAHFTPPTVTATVRAGEREVVAEVQPEYADFQPNGPGCGPICRTALVRIDMSQDP